MKVNWGRTVTFCSGEEAREVLRATGCFFFLAGGDPDSLEVDLRTGACLLPLACLDRERDSLRGGGEGRRRAGAGEAEREWRGAGRREGREGERESERLRRRGGVPRRR